MLSLNEKLSEVQLLRFTSDLSCIAFILFAKVNFTHVRAHVKTTRHWKSTLSLVEDWKSAVDRKELAYILTNDMSKAFDSLSHSLIVKKLEACGFEHNSLNLLRSYFDKRLNRVKIGDVTSDWKKRVLGDPQGSSFGPLLWNLFQNDMLSREILGKSTFSDSRTDTYISPV